MRKIYLALGILVIGTIAMAYLYFSNLKKDTNANELSLNTVTAQSAIVFTYDSDNSFYEILGGQKLFQNILGNEKWKILKSLQQTLSNGEFQKALTGQRVYICFLAGEKDNIDLLIAVQLKDKHDLAKHIKSSKNQFTIENVGGSFSINFGDTAKCFANIKDNLLLLSNDLRTVDKSNSASNKFGEFINANNRFNKNTLANVYIDYNKVPMLLKKVISSNIGGELNIFNKQDAYAALSYNFSSDKILLNGYTELIDEANYYRLFIDEQEQKMSINQLLLNRTANYSFFAINNYKTWRAKLNDYFGKTKELDKINSNIKTINEKYSLEIDKIFPVHFKHQLITFQLNTGEKFGAIELDNGDKVKQLLIDLSKDYAPEIRIFTDANILYDYFGEPFKKFERPFFTIIDNYLVVPNNASSIQSFLNSYQNDELLIKTERYTNFTDQLSSSATICFYVNNTNSSDIFGRNLRGPFWKQYKSKDGFKDFGGFCYQLSADNGKFLTNLLLLKNAKEIETDTTSTSISR